MAAHWIICPQMVGNSNRPPRDHGILQPLGRTTIHSGTVWPGSVGQHHCPCVDGWCTQPWLSTRGQVPWSPCRYPGML